MSETNKLVLNIKKFWKTKEWDYKVKIFTKSCTHKMGNFYKLGCFLLWKFWKIKEFVLSEQFHHDSMAVAELKTHFLKDDLSKELYRIQNFKIFCLQTA